MRAGEGQLAGDHLVEQHAQREDVAAVVDGLAARLLGAHVAQGPEHEARLRLGERLHLGDAVLRLRLGLEQLGEAEVEDLGVAVRRHDHVLGLDVAVHDPGLVRLLQPARHLGRDLDRAERVQLALLDQGPHRAALDQLHRDEEAVLALVDVVDLRDRRVVDGARGAGLPQEAGLAVGLAA